MHTFGIWWENALLFTLLHVNSTIPVPTLMDMIQNLNCSFYQHDAQTPLLTPCLSSSFFLHSPQTRLECSVQTEEVVVSSPSSSLNRSQQQSVSQTTSPQPTPPPKVMEFPIFVYSLCTLTSMPRKESTFSSNLTVSSLCSAFPTTSLFFVNGNPIHSEHLMDWTNDALEKTTLGTLVSESTPIIHIVKCPKCIQSKHVTTLPIDTPYDGKNCYDFTLLHCTKCTDENTTCLYCTHCATAKKAESSGSSSVLFNVDNGRKHMHRMHGIDTQ